ncbi:SgcJ/EcaC family oxidoreductase [Tunturibacter empetritectus]|uniref:SgcJ/EcaC family oxidoreductase n=1 Tax=Tunturiibacter empetritectus TaxID=3069691 RepID=A0AAU7ZGX1_9BACT
MFRSYGKVLVIINDKSTHQLRDAKMRIRNWIGALIMTLTFGTTGCSGVKAAEDTPQVAIEKMLAREQSAWNTGDSASYADEYTEDADFINIRGQVFTGKTAVQQQHAKIFAGPFKGSAIGIVLRKFAQISDLAVLIDTDQTVINFAGLPPGIVESSPGTLVTHFKYLAIKQTDGTWKFTSGQNTVALPN